jgi:hypothetical protein
MPEPPAKYAILRFVRPEDQQRALDAIDYAAAMLGPAIDPGTVEAWCYDLAANGVAYQDWPGLLALRQARGDPPAGDEALALERARRDSEAMGMVDYGEI